MEIDNQRLVGIVHVETASLAFKGDIGLRQVDMRSVNHLIRVFGISCSRDTIENHIPASIRPAELDNFLQASRLTRRDLQRSLLGGPYPHLYLAHEKLYCLHGQHRLEAARKVLRPDDC